MTTAPQSRQDARPAASLPGATLPHARAAVPLSARPAPKSEPLSEAEIVAIARDASKRCALVVIAFCMVSLDRLEGDTRGNPKEAFARQLWMAGMVRGLGFAPAIVGAAVGRHKDTVEHACSIIDALNRDADAESIIRILGEPGVREFLGGKDLIVTTDAQGRLEVVSGGEAVEEMLAHAERVIDDMFAAFELVAVRGGAFCRELARRAKPGASP